jgi:DNA-binding PadR family transcriptional regulator
MQLLATEPGGQYGLELVNNSDGKLKRGSVYVLLSRLEDKGYVKAKEEAPPAGTGGMPRRLYRITGLGQKVLQAYEMLDSVGGLAHAR